jgi:putative oxidoreductase
VSAAGINPQNAQEENQKHEFHRNEFVKFYCAWIFAAVAGSYERRNVFGIFTRSSAPVESNRAELTHTGEAMYSVERYAIVAARILIALIFMMTALNIISSTLAEHAMAANGVPASLIPAMIIAARALQLVAGLGLILGIYPRISALALLLFLIPATLMGHAFWQAVGTPLYPVQLINFFKNVCMAGGLIFIMATRNQPALLPRPAHAN